MELKSWLRSLGLEQYEAAFRENSIDEKVIIRLTADDLKELGVAAVGHRRTLLDAIAALRANAELTGETHAHSPPVKALDSEAARPSSIDSAERRQVTVLFADLVGSTALSARMDPEDLRKVIAAYHKCVAEIVRRFGGFVSQYLGDGVLAYFGYPQAHEDDAERAVRASLELIAAVAALKTRVPLQTRVGIATGLVVVGDVIDAGGSQERGIIGETPNLGARLQGFAAPNTVVIAESTRKLLGNLFELNDLGAKELKGIAEPVRVWTVLRPASVTSRFEALHASGLSAFVGRERELEVLERGLDSCQSHFGVLDVVGDPGMGKSRLLHEFRQRIGKRRVTVLSGSCSPDGQQTPFLPFIEIMRGSFRISAGETQQDVAQKLEAGLTALGIQSARNKGLLLHLLGLSIPDDVLIGLDGVLIGLRTRELLQQLLEARCRLSPVVMIVEDLHWLDSVSEELLGKIVDSEDKLRLLLLTTRRPEYCPPWMNRTVVSKLLLEPLPIGDIRRLMRARLAVETLPEPLAWGVAEKAEGNPLFAEEIISFLKERGVVRTTPGGPDFDPRLLATALPGSVQSLLTARVDSLAQNDRTLLQAASVIGRRFDPQLLATVIGESDVDPRLLEIQGLDLIYREGKSGHYAFKHALIRDALYQSLLNEARAILHGKIAREIEQRSGNRLIEMAEVLAHHYRQTHLADKAFTYLSMAGNKGLNVYSLDEAATQFTAALALLDTNPRCASDDQVADFLVSYSLLLNVTRDVISLVDVIQRYLPRIDRLENDPRVVLIRHQYVNGLLWSARYREAIKVQQETSIIADRLGDSRSRAYGLAAELSITTIICPKTFNEFEILKRQVIKAAAATNDAYIQAWTTYLIGWEELHRGRMIHARNAAHELMQQGRASNDPRSIGQGLALLTWIALASDCYSEALEYSEQSLAIAIAPWDRDAASVGKGCALILLRQTKEGKALLEADRRRFVRDHNFYILCGSDAVIGVCKVLEGNIGGGLSLIDEAILKRESEGYRTCADWYRLFLCEIYLQMVEGKEKLPMLVLLRNLPTLMKVLLTAGSRVLLLIARVLENRQLDPAGHYAGRAQMILGRLYKVKKRNVLAIKHLKEAQRIFSQLGPTPVLERVETALAELGQ